MSLTLNDIYKIFENDMKLEYYLRRRFHITLDATHITAGKWTTLEKGCPELNYVKGEITFVKQDREYTFKLYSETPVIGIYHEDLNERQMRPLEELPDVSRL